VAFHQAGTSYDDDQWELYHLDQDFNECHDLAADQPEKLAEMVSQWWTEADKYKVLPLDDRFAGRFAENAERHRGERTNYTFWQGMGHIPSEVAPDLRSRSYTIEATCVIPDGGASGVLIAHGDATCGYSMFLRDGRLVHDLNVGGEHTIVESDRPVPTGPVTLGFRMHRSDTGATTPSGVGTLLIDGEPAGSFETERIFWLMISWSGLDIGFDRGTTVSDYDGSGRFMGPNEFTGTLVKVVVDLDDDQQIDHQGHAENELARD
jgi:hypothetical protein